MLQRTIWIFDNTIGKVRNEMPSVFGLCKCIMIWNTALELDHLSKNNMDEYSKQIMIQTFYSSFGLSMPLETEGGHNCNRNHQHQYVFSPWGLEQKHFNRIMRDVTLDLGTQFFDNNRHERMQSNYNMCIIHDCHAVSAEDNTWTTLVLSQAPGEG